VYYAKQNKNQSQILGYDKSPFDSLCWDAPVAKRLFAGTGTWRQGKRQVGKSEEATPHRIVIAPVTISIPDESALINALRPFSTPPDPLSIVFEDGRVILVRGIDWQTAPASGTAKTPPNGIKWCNCGGDLRRHMCPESWSCADCCAVIKKAFEARTLLPRDRDYGPVLVFEAKQKQGRFLDPTERMFKEELSKIDGILSQAGLQ
jgi:hypothetical protein